MVQNIIYRPWEGTKGPRLCLWLNYYCFALSDCFFCFCIFSLLWLNLFFWLKFFRTKDGLRIQGTRTIESCSVSLLHFLRCFSLPCLSPVGNPRDGSETWVDFPHRLSVCVLSRFSCVRLFATLWTVGLQAPLSIGLSRQENWSGLPCPPPGDLPHPGIILESLMSPA